MTSLPYGRENEFLLLPLHRRFCAKHRTVVWSASPAHLHVLTACLLCCRNRLCVCRSRWFVTSSIIGATSLEQLKENLDAFSITLPEEAFDDINAIYRKYRDPPTSA